MAALKRLLLEDVHESLGADFGEFAGWRVPMVYTSTLEEHMAVRTGVGLFDISHMGRLRIAGPGSLDLLERLYTKRLGKTKIGFMSGPTLALNEYARVKDDEMFYRVSDDEWLVVPNAAVKDLMLEYLGSWARRLGLKDVVVEDLTGKYALLALQGPMAESVVRKLGGGDIAGLKPLEFIVDTSLAGARIYLASRSGWTGEDGFEFWVEPGEARRLYKAFLDAGVKPVGIAARDTLRIEMGFVLGGHEYGEDPVVYPCALSLRYGMGAIDWDKTGYVGEPMLRACRKEGIRWVRIGLIMKKKSARFIPRQGYSITIEGQPVGWVTSGTYSPVRRRGIGMGYIDVRYAVFGEPVEIVAPSGRSGMAKLSDFPLIEKK